VPKGNVSALADAMRRLIDRPELRASMGDSAKLKSEHFKAGSVVPRIERIYRNLAAKTSPRPELMHETSG
jgi:glycosyltransferase involved in cell wall biosynthesis